MASGYPFNQPGYVGGQPAFGAYPPPPPHGSSGAAAPPGAGYPPAVLPAHHSAGAAYAAQHAAYAAAVAAAQKTPAVTPCAAAYGSAFTASPGSSQGGQQQSGQSSQTPPAGYPPMAGYPAGYPGMAGYTGYSQATAAFGGCPPGYPGYYGYPPNLPPPGAPPPAPGRDGQKRGERDERDGSRRSRGCDDTRRGDYDARDDRRRGRDDSRRDYDGDDRRRGRDDSRREYGGRDDYTRKDYGDDRRRGREDPRPWRDKEYRDWDDSKRRRTDQGRGGWNNSEQGYSSGAHDRGNSTSTPDGGGAAGGHPEPPPAPTDNATGPGPADGQTEKQGAPATSDGQTDATATPEPAMPVAPQSKAAMKKTGAPLILELMKRAKAKAEAMTPAMPKVRAIVPDLTGLTPKERSDQLEEEHKRHRDLHPEPSRALKPLQLLKERSSNQWEWTTCIEDEHNRSWMYLTDRRRDILQADLLKLQTEIDWVDIVGGSDNVTRRTMWFVKEGFDCPYHYGTISVPARPFPDWFLEMAKRWLSCLNLNDEDEDSRFPDCVNLNLYENGNHLVAWHADDETLFQGKFKDIRIISVSLGAPRKFQVGFRAPRRGGVLKPERGSIQSFTLAHGALSTMEGMFQKHYLHQIAKGAPTGGPRINATFRYIEEHVRS